MSRLFQLLMIAAFASAAVTSCQKEPGLPDNPDEVIDRARTSEGVTLEVSDVTETDFVFRTIPGADIKGYRFDIMPMADYYEKLMDWDAEGITERELIRKLLFDSAGGLFAFSEPLNLSYAKWTASRKPLIPGTDYILLAAGASEPTSLECKEITKLRVSLVKKTEGNPVVTIEPKAGYKDISFSFKMNQECSGYYYMISTPEKIDRYCKFVAARGGDSVAMLRDLTCNYLLAPRNADTTFLSDYAFYAKPGMAETALVVPLDRNGMPLETIIRQSAVLTDPPVYGSAKYSMTVKTVNATSCVTEWNVDMSVTRNAYHNYLTLSDLRNWMETNSIEEITQCFASNVYEKEEYIHNDKIGRVHEQFDLKPDTEYVILSTASNKGIGLLPVRMDTIRTKKLAVDNLAM